MKIPTICQKCVFSDLKSFTFISGIELNDDGVYKLNCPNGHETLLFSQEQQFEVLVELGSLALLDGYTREAVSNFAVALERFYEFCILILLHHKNIKIEGIEAAWKFVAISSERQLGAFIYLYLSEFGSPPIFAESKKEFRNKVIHKGHIPSYQKAKEYASFVFEHILSLLKILKEHCGTAPFLKVITRNQMKNQQLSMQYGIGNVITSSGFTSVINISYADEILFSKDFEKALEDLKIRREIGFSLSN